MPNTGKKKPGTRGDALIREMWRIKDELSAARGHDIGRMCAEAREKQKYSGHPIVTLSPQRAKAIREALRDIKA